MNQTHGRQAELFARIEGARIHLLSSQRGDKNFTRYWDKKFDHSAILESSESQVLHIAYFHLIQIHILA